MANIVDRRGWSRTVGQMKKISCPVVNLCYIIPLIYLNQYKIYLEFERNRLAC